MRNKKNTTTLRNDLMWLKRNQRVHTRYDFLFAICMAGGLTGLFSLIIN